MAANILSLDIGERRIGVALADFSAPFPAPVTTLEAGDSLVADLESLLKKHHVKAVVIGLPRNQSGERTKQTDRVEKIVSLLGIPESIPIYWQDESLTSVKAEKELESRKKPYTKAAVDALAATYILEDFIRANPSLKSTKLPETKPLLNTTESAVTDATGRKVKKWSAKRIILILASAVVILAAAAATLVGLWYVNNIKPRTKEDVYSTVTVRQGSGASDIGKELEAKKVIKSAAAFSLYVRLNNVANLQAGEYRVSSKQSVREITEVIAGGKVVTIDVLIAPGQTISQIKAVLIKSGFMEGDVEQALTKARAHSLLKNVPKNSPLEGYLFPDTYKISPSTSVDHLMWLMLDTMEKKIAEDPSIMSGLQKQGLTLEQGVIMASIVQKEVPDYETQQKVAQVFLRRYKEGMPLGADPTFKYAASITNQPASPAIDSPYNTRKFAGLPPSAISNFNINALKAVANPAPTNYLYFVAGDDKVTYFSNTLSEHETLTKRHCTTLCN